MTSLGVILSGMLAAATSLLVIRGLHPAAHRLGLIDHPGERRKLHSHAVPPIGGIALFSGVLAAILLATQLIGLTLHGLGAGLTGAAVLVIVGLLDDRFSLGFRTRFLAQLIAVLILAVGGGVQLQVLGDLFGAGPIHLGLFALPFTLFAAVGIINAFNMIDGIDGLAAGLFLVAVVALLFSSPPEAALYSFLLPVVAIGLLPFLACNLSLPGCKRHKVFLGDAGSMLLGYIVAWALIDASQSASSIAPVTALWFVAIPLLDTLNVMGRRLRCGRSPFKADRGHLHHVLTRSTGSPRAALLTMITLAIALALPAVLGVSLELAEPGYFYPALATFALYIALLTRAPRLHRYLCRKRRSLPRSASPRRPHNRLRLCLDRPAGFALLKTHNASASPHRIKHCDLWDIGWLFQKGVDLPTDLMPAKISDHQWIKVERALDTPEGPQSFPNRRSLAPGA